MKEVDVRGKIAQSVEELNGEAACRSRVSALQQTLPESCDLDPLTL
jgi:hypothetical protein